MTDFGVTGTRRMLDEGERFYVHRVVQRALLGWPRGVPRETPQSRKKPFPHKLVSGVQWGVDTEAVLAVWGLIPFENIVLVVPGTAQHNWGLVDRAEKLGAKVVKGPTLHTASATYLARNDILIEHLRVLLAFPQQPTFYRSGTWATINRARKAQHKVRLYPLINAD